MIAEARRRRLAELPRRKAAQCRQELWIEAGFRALHPAEIAAARAGDRIGRLFLRHVLELGRAAHDLRAQPPRVGERGGGVAGVGNLGLRDEAEPGRRRTLEVVLVGRVVALQLGVGQRGERGGDLLGTDGEYRDGDRLVLIAPDAPQLRVGDVHVGREVLLQLALREVFAVQRLDLGPELLARAAQVALPLRDVELTVRLKGRVFHDLPQDLRRRTAPRHLADLVVRHLDAEPAAFAHDRTWTCGPEGDGGGKSPGTRAMKLKRPGPHCDRPRRRLNTIFARFPQELRPWSIPAKSTSSHGDGPRTRRAATSPPWRTPI